MPSPLRIRFLKYAAGPDFGPFSPGDETELPYDRARVLLDAGEAERLGSVEPERAEEPVPTEPPQVERAVLRQPETAVGPAQLDQRTAEPVAESVPLEEDEDLLQDEPTPEGASVEEAPLEENPTAEADSDQDPNYQAGRQAAREGQPRASNPNDGRTAPGRAWLRGYDAAGPDDVA